MKAFLAGLLASSAIVAAAAPAHAATGGPPPPPRRGRPPTPLPTSERRPIWQQPRPQRQTSLSSWPRLNNSSSPPSRRQLPTGRKRMR